MIFQLLATSHPRCPFMVAPLARRSTFLLLPLCLNRGGRGRVTAGRLMWWGWLRIGWGDEWISTVRCGSRSLWVKRSHSCQSSWFLVRCLVLLSLCVAEMGGDTRAVILAN
jgi:hypothetical protein